MHKGLHGMRFLELCSNQRVQITIDPSVTLEAQHGHGCMALDSLEAFFVKSFKVSSIVVYS